MGPVSCPLPVSPRSRQELRQVRMLESHLSSLQPRGPAPMHLEPPGPGVGSQDSSGVGRPGVHEASGLKLCLPKSRPWSTVRAPDNCKKRWGLFLPPVSTGTTVPATCVDLGPRGPYAEPPGSSALLLMCPTHERQLRPRPGPPQHGGSVIHTCSQSGLVTSPEWQPLLPRVHVTRCNGVAAGFVLLPPAAFLFLQETDLGPFSNWDPQK